MKKKILSLMLTLALILSLIPAFTLTASAAGTIHYVKESGAGSYDGTSWDDAFHSLQAALAAAADGDIIFVAKGTYTQTAEYLLDSKDIKIYGSFDGTESSLDERTFAAGHSSVLEAGGTCRVFSLNNCTNATVIDGFKITGGSGDEGGGIRNQNSSPVLANLTISGNTATTNGGGMYNIASSSPVLTNVTISGNTVSSGTGGGIFNTNSSPVLTNVTISSNTSTQDGGGMANADSSPVLTNVIISTNTGGSGGGMANDNSSPVLTNVTISGNSADLDGGGGILSVNNSSPVLYNSIVAGNNAAYNGDEVYNLINSAPVYNHSLVVGVTTADANGNIDGIGITATDIFANPTSSDYTLASDSPAIGVGSTDYWTVNTHTQLGGKTLFNYLGSD